MFSNKIARIYSYLRPLLTPELKSGYLSQIIGDVNIGKTVNFGKKVLVSSSTIGDNCSILNNTSIYDSNFGNFVIIHGDSTIVLSRIGRFSYVGPQAVIGMTTIGSFCSIGPGFICGYGDHPADFASSNPVFYSLQKQCGTTFANKEFFQEHKNISVGHDVWIGARVFIRDGVTVGNGAIIGAGSVVVKDVPDYAIVGGIPARVIKYRFDEETIAGLLALEWWNWKEGKLREAQPYMASNNIKVFLEKYSETKGSQE